MLHSHDPIPVLPRVRERLGERVPDGVAGQATGERAPQPGFGPHHELLELAIACHVHYAAV
ncbi:MAG: hypothetical protein E6G60_21335 [Actinobacteria bacterium]|nr:MAG: hypothetical protein E6G60_21335 [Actinomycetota bacterium]